MIKLSWLARATDAEVFEEHINFTIDAGLDVIDFHLSGMPRDPEFLTRIKAMCVRGGLPIGYMGGGSFVGPEEARAERLEKGRADVDMAAFMGAQMLRVFARHKWPDTEEEQEKYWGPMIEDFQECADYAAQEGVVLALQNHNHGSFAMNADQVLRILREVDKPNFTYIMDTGQWEGAIGGSPRGWRDFTVDIYRDHMERVAEHTSLVRAKIYKIDNGWEEWLDYPRIFKILRRHRFNGNVSLVFEGGAPPRNRFDKYECVRLGAQHLRQVIDLAYLYH